MPRGGLRRRVPHLRRGELVRPVRPPAPGHDECVDDDRPAARSATTATRRLVARRPFGYARAARRRLLAAARADDPPPGRARPPRSRRVRRPALIPWGSWCRRDHLRSQLRLLLAARLPLPHHGGDRGLAPICPRRAHRRAHLRRRPGGRPPRDRACCSRSSGYARASTSAPASGAGSTRRSRASTGRLLDRAEARELSERGMELGSHAMTHRDLRKLDDRELQDELTRSKAEIEDLTGRAMPRPRLSLRPARRCASSRPPARPATTWRSDGVPASGGATRCRACPARRATAGCGSASSCSVYDAPPAEATSPRRRRKFVMRR